MEKLRHDPIPRHSGLCHSRKGRTTVRRDEPGRGEKAKRQRAPSGKSRSKGQLARRKILVVQRFLNSHTPPRRREISFSREAAFFCFPFFKLKIKNLRAILPPDFFFFGPGMDASGSGWGGDRGLAALSIPGVKTLPLPRTKMAAPAFPLPHPSPKPPPAPRPLPPPPSLPPRRGRN